MILHLSDLPGTIMTHESPELVNQFLTWSKENSISSNPSKCKELILRKKNNEMNDEKYAPISRDIAQCKDLPLLGVTFLGDPKFRSHLTIILTTANKCLHVLRTLRKEQYNQGEVDHMFRALFCLMYCTI